MFVCILQFSTIWTWIIVQLSICLIWSLFLFSTIILSALINALLDRLLFVLRRLNLNFFFWFLWILNWWLSTYFIILIFYNLFLTMIRSCFLVWVYLTAVLRLIIWFMFLRLGWLISYFLFCAILWIIWFTFYLTSLFLILTLFFWLMTFLITLCLRILIWSLGLRILIRLLRLGILNWFLGLWILVWFLSLRILIWFLSLRILVWFLSLRILSWFLSLVLRI